ncbi:hypothetical protein EV715DRAFT_298279 [Schizophyllum commune]
MSHLPSHHHHHSHPTTPIVEWLPRDARRRKKRVRGLKRAPKRRRARTSDTHLTTLPSTAPLRRPPSLQPSNAPYLEPPPPRPGIGQPRTLSLPIPQPTLIPTLSWPARRAQAKHVECARLTYSPSPSPTPLPSVRAVRRQRLPAPRYSSARGDAVLPPASPPFLFTPSSLFARTRGQGLVAGDKEGRQGAAGRAVRVPAKGARAASDGLAVRIRVGYACKGGPR